MPCLLERLCQPIVRAGLAVSLLVSPAAVPAGVITVHFEGTLVNQCEVTGDPGCHGEVYLHAGTGYSGQVTLDLDRLTDPRVVELTDPDDHLYNFRGELYANDFDKGTDVDPFLLALELEGEGWSYSMAAAPPDRESLYLKRFLEPTPFSDYNAIRAGAVELYFAADWTGLDNYTTGASKHSGTLLWLHGVRYHFPPDSGLCCHPAYRVYGFHDRAWVEDMTGLPSAASIALLLTGLPLLWLWRVRPARCCGSGATPGSCKA